MRHGGFKANEAMGWLRIVRPGSVIGPQQHYLKALESRPRVEVRVSPTGGSRPSRDQLDFKSLMSSSCPEPRDESTLAADLAAQVTASMCSRGASRLDAGPALYSLNLSSSRTRLAPKNRAAGDCGTPDGSARRSSFFSCFRAPAVLGYGFASRAAPTFQPKGRGPGVPSEPAAKL
jgi:hypothetical protein